MILEKTPSLRGKSDANECNESSLSNCRVQLALSKKRDGVIFEKIPHQPQGDRIYLTYIGIPQFLISIISCSSSSRRNAIS